MHVRFVHVLFNVDQLYLIHGHFLGENPKIAKYVKTKTLI